MKKVMCIILVIAMMLGFVAMLAVETFADSYDTELEFDELKSAANASATVIDRLDFILPSLEPGAAVPEKPDIQVMTGNVSWVGSWTSESGEELEDTVFQENKAYYMGAVIYADEGFVFGEGISINWTGACTSASYHANEDGTIFIVIFEVYSRWQEVDRLELSSLPEEINLGAAPAVQVEPISPNFQVTGARWVSESKQPVTSFQDGKIYFLEVTVKPDTGFVIPDWADIYAENRWNADIQMQADGSCKAYFRYSLLKKIDRVRLAVNDPALGMEINQLSVTVLEGEVIAMPVAVHDVVTGYPVEEPELLDNKTYALWYSFMPKEGYELTDGFLDVEVVDANFEVQWSHDPESMVFCRYFSTCEPIERVELTASNLTLGSKLSDVQLTAPAGAKVTIGNVSVYCTESSEDPERFCEGADYGMEWQMTPAEGYVLSYDTVMTINGREVRVQPEEGGIRGYGWMNFGFTVNDLELWNLPDEIYAGEAETPEVRGNYDKVTVSQVQWLDENKQSVTSFQDGKTYYLAVTMEAVTPRKFTNDLNITLEGVNKPFRFEKLSDTKGVLYITYALLPNAGDLAITLTGLQEGKNIESVTASVAGNATVKEIQINQLVYVEEGDYYEEQPVESGKFASSTNYRIYVTLEPKEGYRILGDAIITVNGKENYNYNIHGGVLQLTESFTTCKKITSAAVTLATPTVGKDAPAPKVDSKANFTVTYEWRETTDYSSVEHTGKLVKGHAYSLFITLKAKPGYVFDEDCAFTLNGQKASFDINKYEPMQADSAQRYSFLEKIQKVELPAMPDKITLGQDLPVNFTLEGKNYTLEAYWSRYNGGEGQDCDKADKKDIYGLVFNVRAKDGYEFDEKTTKVYVDGKLADTPFLSIYESGLSVQKIYVVGLKEVTRVDLIVTGMEAGKIPTVTATGEGYVLAESAWAQGNQPEMDEYMEDLNIVEKLANGKYTFLGVMLMPAEGYAFSQDLVYYINGKAVTPDVEQNISFQTTSFLPMGKLGEIEKLTAPKVEVQGNGIVWESVLSADCYEIYRATSKSGKYTKVATVEETSWEDAAMAKTYYYKVKAICSVDSSKSSGYSNVVSVKFLLEAPVITMGMDEALGKAIIRWNAVEGAKSYEIWRATSETGKYTRVATTKASVTEYTDKYAAVGTAYFYKVKAVASSSAYNSPYSNILSATSVCAQAKLTAKMDTATGKPVISWNKVDGAQNYWLLRRVAGSDLSFEIISRQTKLTFTDTTAQVDVEYEYTMQVIGKEPELNSAFSANVTAVCGLAKPALKGVITGQGKPQLTWDAVEGAVKYEVYRSTKSNKGYTLLDEINSTGVDDMSAAVGKTYYYKIVAVGENSKSPESSYVKLTGKCAAPMIYVENAASGKPLVSWGKVDGAKQYTIYRASSETGKYSKAGTTKSLYYEDKKASGGKTYFYKVVANASKSSYSSGYSNIFSCDVICGAPSVTVKVDIATGKPMLSWKKVDLAAGYRIYRQLPGQEFVVIAEQTGLSFVDTTAPIDTLCIYKVQTIGKTEGLDSGFTKELSVTSAIAQPKLSSGVNADGKPHFNWQPIEGAVKYEIYRSTKSNKGYTLLATVEEVNAYVDETVAGGKTFYYKVKAVGNVSSSESSYVKLTGKCAAPQISVALHETSGKPVLSWEKVSGAKQYTVYRATSMEGKYTKLGTTKSGTYTDSKATPGTEYFYKVIANGSKSSYNSIYSNVAVTIGYAAKPQVTLKNDSKGKPVVSWKKISEAEKYMVVYVDITDVEKEEDLTENFILENMQYVEVSKKKTSTTLSQAQTGRIYMVIVVAVPKNEEFSGVSLPGYVASTCAAPKISGKYIQGYNCGTWKAVEGAQFYAIYRSTKKSSGYQLIGTVDNDSSFADLYAVKGKTYYYKVTACTQYTESAMSNYIKLKTK